MKKILVLASNPRKDLKLDREIRDLKNVVERSRNHAQFEVEIELAVRPGDLQHILLKHEPRIVHFCGHGTGEQGLVFENDAGREQLISTNALSNLFEFFNDKVECVLLNACYSEVQANAIIQHINYVAGMSQAIRDDAAIAFTTGFYLGLGYGKSIEQSYKFGCNAIQLQISDAVTSRSRSPEESRKLVAVDAAEQVLIAEHLKPVLKKKPHLTPILEEMTSARSGDYPDSSTQSDVPPELSKAVKEEIARKRYRDRTREAWDDFGQAPASRVQSLTQQEYRQRQVLLGKVKDFWIKGVLENSLHNNALIKLKLEERPDTVQRSFSGVEELPVEPDDSFEELQATEIFDQMGAGRTLLILGEPGAGKTIALLKLAQRLVAQTEKDLSRQPIPVVFNLSSWANKRQTIAEWLVEELKNKYQVSSALGKTWVEQEHLILLLDGLDEVQAEHRNACVRALNQFIEAHGITEIVVCSRVKDYEALSERLELRSAICIQPLTSDQVYQYLDEAGDQFTGLKTLLQHDAELKEFARKPLILSVMSLAYQGCSSQELLNKLGSKEESYQRLFDAYIERMLQRRGATQRYLPEQTKRWLIWLSQRMTRASQKVFLIEQLQPNWLQNRTQRILHLGGSFLIGVLIFGCIGGLLDPLRGGLLGVLSAGLLLVWGKTKIETVETLSWSWQEAKKILIKGLITGLILGLPVALSLGIPKLGLVYGLTGGLIFGLLGGLRGPEIEKKTIPNQGIWNSARNARIVGLIGGLVGMLIGWIGGWVSRVDWLVLGLIYGVVVGLLSGGGKACIRHFTLRLMLYRQGHIPWNYARFLDYATDRLFMQKVGGGYIFVHRMLMEHFAQMKQD